MDNKDTDISANIEPQVDWLEVGFEKTIEELNNRTENTVSKILQENPRWSRKVNFETNGIKFEIIDHPGDTYYKSVGDIWAEEAKKMGLKVMKYETRGKLLNCDDTDDQKEGDHLPHTGLAKGSGRDLHDRQPSWFGNCVGKGDNIHISVYRRGDGYGPGYAKFNYIKREDFIK